MNSRLKNHLILAASVGVLAIAGTLMNLPQKVSAQQGPPDGLAVRIVNPIPVPTTGTITGSVSAAQSGAWNVGILGTPTFNLSAGTTVGLTSGAVVKVEPGSTPLRIRDVNNGAQPFQTELHVTVPNNACCGEVGNF